MSNCHGVPAGRPLSWRELERQEQPRTLKAGSEVEPRLSPADEQQLTDDVRERESEAEREAARLHDLRLEADVARVLKAIARLQQGLEKVDGRTHRDLKQARELVNRVGARHRRSG